MNCIGLFIRIVHIFTKPEILLNPKINKEELFEELVIGKAENNAKSKKLVQ